MILTLLIYASIHPLLSSTYNPYIINFESIQLLIPVFFKAL